MHMDWRRNCDPKTAEDVTTLKGTSLFGASNPGDLADLLMRGRRIAARQGEMLSAPGQNAKVWIVLIRGRGRVYRYSRNGRRVTLFDIHPGEPVDAEMFGLEEDFTSVESAVRTTVAYRIPSEYLFNFLRANPLFAAELLALEKSRLLEAYRRIEHLALYDLRTRLHHELLRRTEGGTQSTVYVTHQELAETLGTTRQRVSVAIRHLTQAGTLHKTGGRRVIHLSHTALQNLNWRPSDDEFGIE